MHSTRQLMVSGLLATFMVSASADAATLRTFTYEGFQSHILSQTQTARGFATLLFDDAAIDAVIAAGSTNAGHVLAPGAIQLVAAQLEVVNAAGEVILARDHTTGSATDISWGVLDGGLAQLNIRLWTLASNGFTIVDGFQLGFSNERIVNEQRRPPFRGTGSVDLRDGAAPDGYTFGSPILGCEGSYAAYFSGSINWMCRYDPGTFSNGVWSLDPASSVTVSVVPLPAAAWLMLSGLGVLAAVRLRQG
ncbi:MAG: VPLPA-CTERM sorting domain-containing protein [Chromatiales bacterium]|nr:VPLPA-CTERM sorting domain-containing protein [Chromatiales bacterium]